MVTEEYTSFISSNQGYGRKKDARILLKVNFPVLYQVALAADGEFLKWNIF